LDEPATLEATMRILWAVALWCLVLACGVLDAQEAKRVQVIKLFNGRDLSGWKAYLADPNAKMEDVWRVEDGILICKGEPLGYIYTEQDYKNYILKVEWRWAPDKKPGNSGVLLRVHGEHKIWPRSVEAQLMHMNAGDFWLIDGAPLQTDPEYMSTKTPHATAGAKRPPRSPRLSGTSTKSSSTTTRLSSR
jgi:hypothetical protein